MSQILAKGKDFVIVIKEAGEDSEKMDLPGMNPVYRLDKPVRGILALTSKGSKLEILSKRYFLVCTGSFDEPRGTMTDYLFHDSRSNRTFPVKKMRKGVKEASLEYEVLGYDEKNNLTYLCAVLGTGRTHQIRAQFASRKHPLAGDGKYGSRIKGAVSLMCGEITYKTAPDSGEEQIKIAPEDVFPWNLFA